jgi:carbamoyl-phosphate synthase large subunit
VLVRPSFVLGGRAMEIVYDEASLARYVGHAMEVSPGKPVLIDKFLESAIEVDVDCLADGRRCYVGGVMQHIEEAGIHSGDSACVIPPHSLPGAVVEEIKRQARELARELNDLRKRLDLDLTDRIELTLAVGPRVEAALASYRDWVAGEVLATSIEVAAADRVSLGADAHRLDIDGEPLGVLLRRV